MNAKARESARKALLRLQSAVHDLNQELSQPCAIDHAVNGWGAEDLVKAFLRFDRLRMSAAIRVRRCAEAPPTKRGRR